MILKSIIFSKVKQKTYFVMNLLVLSIAPGLAICLFIYFKDKFNKEPLIWLLLSFILGMLSIVPAVIAEILLKSPAEVYFGTGMAGTAASAYAIVGLSEELSKFLVLRYAIYNRSSFDDPFDGIVYSVFISMGFATLENIGYVMQHGFATGIVRMFLSVPAHATFGVLMGYYVGLAKFNPSRKVRYLFLGLLWAVLFHGTFDFFLFLGNTWMHVAGALLSFVVAIRLSRKAIRKKQSISGTYFQNKDYPTSSNKSLFND